MGLLRYLSTVCAAIFNAIDPQTDARLLLAQRLVLDDEAFFQAFYASTGIPKDVPIRTRKVFARELGEHWLKICPSDKPAEMIDELDLAELLYDLEEEFSVKISDEAMQRLDGSFDSVVRYFASLVATNRRDAE